MHVLVINAGSATLKYKLVRVNGDALRILAEGREELDHGHGEAVTRLLGTLPARPDAVAHRWVHGGDRFGDVALVTDAVIAELESLLPLNPLHGEGTLAGLRATRHLGVPVVAAFDTAFHRTLPPVARRYAVPAETAVHRYGFHGWSCRSVMERYVELTGRANPSLIVLHLGNGASATAIRDGRSVDTSMGLSVLEGLVMGTRPGDIDAGVLLHLLRTGHTPETLTDLLYRRSGLQALAGESDVRPLLARRDSDAAFALELFCYRVRKYVGAYLAVLEGRAQALIFTGGIGEGSSLIRGRIATPLAWAGLAYGEDHDGTREGRISAAGSRLEAWVIPTREEELIAREAARLLGAPGGGA
ncbi:MAG: acetate kinase [Gemmatimonadetes bacterium]|nr:acetate kinase [Gemmatimonadota bacterium]